MSRGMLLYFPPLLPVSNVFWLGPIPLQHCPTFVFHPSIVFGTASTISQSPSISIELIIYYYFWSGLLPLDLNSRPLSYLNPIEDDQNMARQYFLRLARHLASLVSFLIVFSRVSPGAVAKWTVFGLAILLVASTREHMLTFAGKVLPRRRALIPAVEVLLRKRHRGPIRQA